MPSVVSLEQAEKWREKFQRQCLPADIPHDMIVVYQTSEDSSGASEVVRWCRTCGAVVVDVDVDNRTSPGHIRKITWPEIARYNGVAFGGDLCAGRGERP